MKDSIKNLMAANLVKTFCATALLCLVSSAQAFPNLTGPSRQNVNRTAAYRVSEYGLPDNTVNKVTVQLADNPYWIGKGWLGSVDFYKPQAGWAANPPAYTWWLQGAAFDRTFAARMIYYHSNGWVETLYATNLFVKNAGYAGNLNSVKLNTYSVWGGHNGTDPTMTVYLDGPAQVGGQWVDVTVNDKDAWCLNGFKGFWIQEGYTYGSVSWFLGTRNVIFNQVANINCYVNGQLGIASIQIRK